MQKTKFVVVLFALVAVAAATFWAISQADNKSSNVPLDKNDPFRLVQAAKQIADMEAHQDDPTFIDAKTRAYLPTLEAYGKIDELITHLDPESTSLKRLNRLAFQMAKGGKSDEQVVNKLTPFQNKSSRLKTIRNLKVSLQPGLALGKLHYAVEHGQKQQIDELSEQNLQLKLKKSLGTERKLQITSSHYRTLIIELVKHSRTEHAAELLLAAEEFRKPPASSVGKPVIEELAKILNTAVSVSILQHVAKEKPSLASELAGAFLKQILGNQDIPGSDIEYNDSVDRMLEFICDTESGAVGELLIRREAARDPRVNESIKSKLESEILNALKTQDDVSIRRKMYLARELSTKNRIAAYEYLYLNCRGFTRRECLEALVFARAEAGELLKAKKCFYQMMGTSRKHNQGRAFFLAAIACDAFPEAEWEFQRARYMDQHYEDFEKDNAAAWDQYKKFLATLDEELDRKRAKAKGVEYQPPEVEPIDDEVGNARNDGIQISEAGVNAVPNEFMSRNERHATSRSRHMKMLLTAAKADYQDPQPILHWLAQLKEDNSSTDVVREQINSMFMFKILPKFLEKNQIRQLESILRELPDDRKNRNFKDNFRYKIVQYLLKHDKVETAGRYVQAVKKLIAQEMDTSDSRRRFNRTSWIDRSLLNYYSRTGNKAEIKALVQSAIRAGGTVGFTRSSTPDPAWYRECLPDLKKMDKPLLYGFIKGSSYTLARMGDVELCMELGSLIEQPFVRYIFFINTARAFARRENQFEAKF